MKTKKRVMIITDSVGLPRKEVPYEDTWVYMLKKNYSGFDFIERPSRGGTTERLVSEGGLGVDLLELYEPDIAIIQLGITDCAPRYFNKNEFEYKFINRLPASVRNHYIERVKKNRTRNPQKTYVSPARFKENTSSYIQRAIKTGTQVIFIAIIKPSTLFTQKSPYIADNVNKYNKIYSETCNELDNATFINPFEKLKNADSICVDELHINSAGSLLIYNSIKNSSVFKDL